MESDDQGKEYIQRVVRQGLLNHDDKIETIIEDIVDVHDTWDQSLLKINEAIKRKEERKQIHKDL